MIQTAPLPSEDLRAHVAACAPWTTDASWSVLFGGRTNTAWQVNNGQNALILKLYRAESTNPLFPNGANAEALMLGHLSGLAISPELIGTFDSATTKAILYHAIPGKPWQSDTAKVAEMMRYLHGLAIPEGLRTLPNGSLDILAHAEAILRVTGQTQDITRLRPNLDVPACDRTALLHCDIVPGNLIENQSGLHLIDWQCPGVGDPCEDIAIFLSPAMQLLYRGSPLSAEETTSFLEAYPEHRARYQSLASAYHYRMAAYCQWKVEQGVAEYAAGKDAELSALSACL